KTRKKSVPASNAASSSAISTNTKSVTSSSVTNSKKSRRSCEQRRASSDEGREYHPSTLGTRPSTIPMKHRLERVKEVIKRELSEIIPREMTFHATLVTVQDADITPDLKNCFVYVSAIGSEEDKDAAVA